MALRIETTCIACDMCLPVCPNEAIIEGPKVFQILPEKCTECVGFYAKPQCVKACPLDCIEIDPDHPRTLHAPSCDSSTPSSSNPLSPSSLKVSSS